MSKTVDMSIKKLNRKGFNQITEKPKTSSIRYNCWGFVAKFHGWKKNLTWIEEDEMEALLQENTTVVKRPRVGDIVCYRDHIGLTHTAIFLKHKNKEIIHKAGSCPIETITMKQNIATNGWAFYKFSEYRRTKEK